MPIVLGDTTITGLAAGGLPSGTVTEDTIASNAITAAKMGFGVIQTQYVISNTKVSISPGTTFAEASSNYRVSITPIFSNSIIKLHYHVPMGYGAGWAVNHIWNFNAKRFVSGSAQDLSMVAAANSNRPGISGFAGRPSNGFDSNDMTEASGITLFDQPNTTSAIQYGFHARIQSGTLYFGHSSSNGSSWHWTSAVVIIAQEIKQ